MSIGNVVAIITEFITLLGFIIGFIIYLKKIINGIKCQLRTDMLDVYYDNRESQTIHQYEYENFVYNYEAYKALKGNSFIDKIYEDVKTWEIVL